MNDSCCVAPEGVKEELSRLLGNMVATAEARGDVLPLLKTLSELVSRVEEQLHPQLRHYLENRSYQKARAFLEGQTPCSHHHH